MLSHLLIAGACLCNSLGIIILCVVIKKQMNQIKLLRAMNRSTENWQAFFADEIGKIEVKLGFAKSYPDYIMKVMESVVGTTLENLREDVEEDMKKGIKGAKECKEKMDTFDELMKELKEKDSTIKKKAGRPKGSKNVKK